MLTSNQKGWAAELWKELKQSPATSSLSCWYNTGWGSILYVSFVNFWVASAFWSWLTDVERDLAFCCCSPPVSTSNHGGFVYVLHVEGSLDYLLMSPKLFILGIDGILVDRGPACVCLVPMLHAESIWISTTHTKLGRVRCAWRFPEY